MSRAQADLTYSSFSILLIGICTSKGPCRVEHTNAGNL